MKIEYFHASKYGNGAMVAQEFKTIMSVENDMVNVQHIRDAHPPKLRRTCRKVSSSRWTVRSC
jgi:hypothetical protein